MGEGPRRLLSLCASWVFVIENSPSTASRARPMARRARAPGWSEGSQGFLCVPESADLPGRRQIRAPAQTTPALPGPPGPYAAACSPALPGFLSPRPASLSLSPPSPSVFLSASTLIRLPPDLSDPLVSPRETPSGLGPGLGPGLGLQALGKRRSGAATGRLG